MNTNEESLNKRLHSLENAKHRAEKLLQDDGLAHAHEVISTLLANIVLARAYTQSSLTLLKAKGGLNG